MPALSSTMTEGKIVEWLKQPGDKVARGESVLVVESDKADMDVESFQDGYLAAVLMPAGSTAPVGETIGLIVETEAEIADAQAKAPSAPAAASAPAPALLSVGGVRDVLVKVVYQPSDRATLSATVRPPSRATLTYLCGIIYFAN